MMAVRVKWVSAMIVAAMTTCPCHAARPLDELQRDFVNLRFGMFIHYSMQTYLNVEHAPPRQDLKLFHPTNLDCQQWADAAKSARMTYGVLTAKHLDGFTLWDSEYTEYDVANSSYQGDIVAEFLEAFRSRGLKTGLYYSIGDKQQGIMKGEVEPDDIEFIKKQLTELLTNYGKIEFLVFDSWGNYWGLNTPMFDEIPYIGIYKHIKSLQPDCLVITHQKERNVTDIPHYEQNAGWKISQDSIWPAQSGPCLQSRWFWDLKHPEEEPKSVDFVVNECLIPFNKINCNLLLNCAPNREGRMDDNIIRRLKEIGEAWTPPAPLATIPQQWKDWPRPFPADRKAESLTLGKAATASNVYQNHPSAVGKKAVDGDPATRWSTDGTQSQATLTIDLGAPQRIGEAYLSEPYGRVLAFELQYLREGKWHTFARGGKIGSGLQMEFPPVTAEKVRLNITDAPGGPSIWEFMLFGPKTTRATNVPPDTR